MTRKLSLIILIITLLSLVFSLTSCNSVGENITNSLTAILPDKDSSPVAELAHNIANWIGDQLSSFFSFNWAKSTWQWLDTTLHITHIINQTGEAVDLIKTGDFMNIISGIGTIFSCGVLLLILGLLVIIAVILAILIQFCSEVIFAVLSIVLVIVVLILAVLGFIYVILPIF